MIYINQLGHCELGRGENMGEAILDAQAFFPDLKITDIHDQWEQLSDGEVIWTDEIDPDYNN